MKKFVIAMLLAVMIGFAGASGVSAADFDYEDGYAYVYTDYFGDYEFDDYEAVEDEYIFEDADK
jgi:hypothetical protein